MLHRRKHNSNYTIRTLFMVILSLMSDSIAAAAFMCKCFEHRITPISFRVPRISGHRTCVPNINNSKNIVKLNERTKATMERCKWWLVLCKRDRKPSNVTLSVVRFKLIMLNQIMCVCVCILSCTHITHTNVFCLCALLK